MNALYSTARRSGTAPEQTTGLRRYRSLAGMALALLLAGTAWAADILVTTTADELDNIIANGTCSLREAVISSNERRDVGGCTNTNTVEGYGIDTITLPTGTYTLDRWTISLVIDQDADNLNVFGHLTINGAGTSATVIQGPTRGLDEHGGLIKVEEGANLTLNDLTLRNGFAADRGGIIYNGGSLQLDHVVVEDGRVHFGSAGGGGGIWSSLGATFSMVDSTVRNNTTDGNGGGLYLDDTATITNSTISGNSAEGDGGGIWNFSTTTIVNSTISGNTAEGSGGGIYNILNTPFLSLDSVTITDNTVDLSGGNGGGIFTDETNPDEIEIHNSLIAGNFDLSLAGADHPDCSGTFTSLDHNLIGDGSGCFGFDQSADQVGDSVNPIDPLVGPLLSNGGFTKTHALLLISPAVDAGPISCQATDQRGFARPNDGDGSTTAECDVGAYEAPEGELQEADLSVTLTAPTTVALSEEFTLEALVFNSGPGTAQNVVIDIQLDPSLIPNPFPGDICSFAAGVYSCELGNLAIGESASFDIFATAPASPGLVTSQVSARADNDDPFAANDGDQATTLVVSSADVAVAISDSADPIEPFDTVFYTFTVSNAGPEPAGGVTLFASIVDDPGTGAGATIINYGGCVPQSTQFVICPLGTLEAGTSSEVTLTVQAHALEGEISAEATVVAAGDDPNPDNDSAAETTTISSDAPPTEGADQILSMSAPTNVRAGTTFSYQLTITNAGPEASTGAELSDTLPTTVTVASLPPVCSLDGNTVNCAVSALAPGSSQTYAIEVTAPDAAGNLVNTASVFNGSPADPQLGNNFAFATTQVTLPSADLTVTKTAPALVQVGSDFSYTVTVSNLGPDFAEGVTLTDTLPGAATFVFAPDGCEHDAGIVTCALGTIDAAVSPTRTVDIVVTAPAAPILLSNSVTVASDTEDPDDSNNSASLETEVTAEAPPPGADLSLTKSAPAAAPPNASLGYVLVVTNNGPDEATAVTVEDALPAGTAFLEAPAACNHAAGVVSCSLGTLAAGSSEMLTLSVIGPAAPGPVTNRATVASATDDPEAGNDQDEATTTIDENAAAASLTALTGANPPASRVVAEGELAAAVLQFAVTNTGSEAVDLDAFGLTRGGSGEAASLGTVALYRDSDGDGSVDPEDELLASGTFANGDLTLTPTSSLELPAAASTVFLVTVDIAPVVAAVHLQIALSLGLVGFGILGWRRRRLAVLALAGLLLLSGCFTREQQQNATFQFGLETVAATGQASGASAQVSGLPLSGATLEVEP